MYAKHKECLSSMLYLDTWRGRDSTGVAAIRSNGDTHILKSTVPGYEFVEGSKLDQHLKVSDFCWIGHNRYGTVGRNIKSNAHPFEILDEDGSCILVGAHNGTLKNKHVLAEHIKFGTDSEALFFQIASTSIEDAISKVEGAWALTYYDHIAEELRIIRNKERPLFYAWEEGRKTFIWASEMWMIRVAASRSDIKLEEDKVYAFAEDTLHMLPAPMKMNETLTMERKGGLVGKAPTFFPQRGRWRNGAWVGGDDPADNLEQKTQTPAQKAAQARTTTSQAALMAAQEATKSGNPLLKHGETQTKESENSSANAQKPGKVQNILTAKIFKGYAGVALSKKELEDQLANGCGWCELEFIGIGDRYAWLAPGKAVCSKCLEGEHEEAKEVKPSNKTSVH